MRYKALTNIHCNFNKYAPGDEIELTDSEAKQLLEDKAIEPFVKPFGKQLNKTALHSNSLVP